MLSSHLHESNISGRKHPHIWRNVKTTLSVFLCRRDVCFWGKKKTTHHNMNPPHPLCVFFHVL